MIGLCVGCSEWDNEAQPTMCSVLRKNYRILMIDTRCTSVDAIEVHLLGHFTS